MKLYALPGLRTYHELTPAYEGSLSTTPPHLKCDPRKEYNDLMQVLDGDAFGTSYRTLIDGRTVWLCGRCFRV